MHIDTAVAGETNGKVWFDVVCCGVVKKTRLGFHKWATAPFYDRVLCSRRAHSVLMW